MFKVKDSIIHCSRGDGGVITLSIPITDVNNNIKYKDTSENEYWYNTKTKELFDTNYEITDVSLETLSMVKYEFQEGDKLTFNIYEKNGYGKEPLMTKDVVVEEVGTSADIPLTAEETTFGNPVNKATIFWYDVTLNDDMTVICYDEDGAKEYIMYPAKGEDN